MMNQLCLQEFMGSVSCSVCWSSDTQKQTDFDCMCVSDRITYTGLEFMTFLPQPHDSSL